jgi:hypothetical protein
MKISILILFAHGVYEAVVLILIDNKLGQVQKRVVVWYYVGLVFL